MKTQRNAPCPCGSGLKYKKCCGKAQPAENKPAYLPPKLHQIILSRFFLDNCFDLEREKKYFEKKFLGLLTGSNKKAELRLKDYLFGVEEEMQNIASRHTVYELLFWSRRLAPKNVFDVADSSVMLYREIQTLCIYKYGVYQENSCICRDTIIPEYLKEYAEMPLSECLEKIEHGLSEEVVRVVSDVLRLEILSFLYLNATQCYRIVNKGGKLVVDYSRNSIGCNTTEDLSFLINLYDERLSKVNLMSEIGAYLKPGQFTGSLVPVIVAQLNVDHKQTVEVCNFGVESYREFFSRYSPVEMKPNYLFGMINLPELYDFLSGFEDEFYREYEFSVSDFILFLSFWGYMLIHKMSIHVHAQMELHDRAYMIDQYDLEYLEKMFEQFYTEEYCLFFGKETGHKIDFRKMFERFTLTDANKSDIDLWTRGPKRFFYRISESYLITDFSCFTRIISQITKDITGVDGEVGNKRAVTFENALVNEIKDQFGESSMWVSRQVIMADDQKKEIDASFVVGDVLILLEAKAVNVSLGFDKGDAQALAFRTGKMKKAIREVDEKARFIRTNRTRLNKKIPDQVKYICPVVVSSHPEYIWANVDGLFISRALRLPRIITVDDIATLKEIDWQALKALNWVCPV